MKGQNRKFKEINDELYFECCTCKGYFSYENFYRHKGTRYGINSRCKTCARASRKNTYYKDPELNREKSREYYNENKEAVKQRVSNYYDINKEEIGYYRKHKRYQEKEVSRMKERAHAAVTAAIACGDMESASTCELCGNEKDLGCVHHHDLYDKAHWYDTIELCRSCHMVLHKRMERNHKRQMGKCK